MRRGRDSVPVENASIIERTPSVTSTTRSPPACSADGAFAASTARTAARIASMYAASMRPRGEPAAPAQEAASGAKAGLLRDAARLRRRGACGPQRSATPAQRVCATGSRRDRRARGPRVRVARDAALPRADTAARAASAARDSRAAVTAGDTCSLVGRHAAGRRAESAGAPLLQPS